jgi:hypothetical protein
MCGRDERGEDVGCGIKDCIMSHTLLRKERVGKIQDTVSLHNIMMCL